MPFSNSGTMIVRTYTAGGALPVPGTVIRIFGADEENRFTEYSVITDINGMTDNISLPAPPKRFSLSPNSDEPSYALYDLEITAPGYFTKRISNISVFDDTQTIQLINMIPLNINQTNNAIPQDNLNNNAQANIDSE